MNITNINYDSEIDHLHSKRISNSVLFAISENGLHILLKEIKVIMQSSLS